jgi:aspartokinase
MTQVLQKIVVDCSTGEQTIVPLTAEEIAQRELDAQAYEAQQAIQEAEEAAKAEAKASAESKLAALGLSAQEIAAITK